MQRIAIKYTFEQFCMTEASQHQKLLKTLKRFFWQTSQVIFSCFRVKFSTAKGTKLAQQFYQFNVLGHCTFANPNIFLCGKLYEIS